MKGKVELPEWSPRSHPDLIFHGSDSSSLNVQQVSQRCILFEEAELSRRSEKQILTSYYLKL